MFAAANEAIEAVRNALHQSATNQLLALYLYGSLSQGTYQPAQSDINLMAVFHDDMDLHGLRSVLRPVWRQHGRILRRMPFLLEHDIFQKHMLLNPCLARNFYQESKIIDGEQLASFSPDTSDTDVLDKDYWTWIAYRTMMASSAIAPSLISEEQKEESLRALRSLVRQVFGRNVSMNEAAVTMLAALMAAVSQSLPGKWTDRLAGGNLRGAPPLIDDLRAIYEVEGWLVMVLPDLPPDQLSDRIVRIDWLTVADSLPDHFRGLRVTTAHQLRLILQYTRPADYLLQNYRHTWGLDPLVGLEVDPCRTLQHLARSPSNLLVATLPHLYITTNDGDLSMLIHDLQNKLLNIQLRDELYCRIVGKSSESAPFVMPDRAEEISARFDAVEGILKWWIDHYLRVINSV